MRRKPHHLEASKDARLDYIVNKMREPGRFNTGKEYPALIAKFKVGIETIKRDCAEASRRVRREINDPDYVAVDVGKAMGQGLDAAREILANNPEDEVKLKAIAQIKNIAHSWAAIVGADAPVRIEQVTTEMTPQEANARARERFGKVTPKTEGE